MNTLFPHTKFTHDDVEIIENRSAYDGFLKLHQLRLRHRQFAGGWSNELKRELVQRARAVGVLLYDPVLDAVALVEQFRIGAYALDNNDSITSVTPWLLELVAGLIDSDESAEQVARREALEEAGVVVQEMEFVCGYFSSPGASNEYLHLFCGRCDLTNVGGIHGLPEEGEDIRVHVVAREDALQRLQAGELCNALTIIALQWLQLNRQRLSELWR